MRGYKKELTIFVLQLMMFYLFPMTAGPTDAMGMVVLIILATFILSAMLGIISDKKSKCLYPTVVSISFIPSVFIYYNETALIHAVWYLVISAAGVIAGRIIREIYYRIRK